MQKPTDLTKAEPRMRTTNRLARAVSYVLNPLLLPPALFASIVWIAGGTPADVGLAIGLAALFFAVIPLVPMIQAVRSHPGTTLELRDRLQRTIPYAAGIGSYLVSIPVLRASSLPVTDILTGIMLCFILNGTLLLVINLFWKISLHVSTIAGCFSIFGFVSVRLLAIESLIRGPGAVLLILLSVSSIGLMMWARVADRAHSVAQVVVGALFGIVMPILELSALEKMGIFDTF